MVPETLRIPIRAAAWRASSAHQPELQPSATCRTMPQIHQTGEAWCRDLQLPPESPGIRVLPSHREEATATGLLISSHKGGFNSGMPSAVPASQTLAVPRRARKPSRPSGSAGRTSAAAIPSWGLPALCRISRQRGTPQQQAMLGSADSCHDHRTFVRTRRPCDRWRPHTGTALSAVLLRDTLLRAGDACRKLWGSSTVAAALPRPSRDHVRTAAA